MEKKQLSSNFKQYYPLLLIAKVGVLSVCVFYFVIYFTVARDLMSILISGLIGVIVFLAISWRFLRTLERLWQKESVSDIEWFLIITFLLPILPLIMTGHSMSMEALIIVSLVAGFTGGITLAELLFLRRVWKE